MEENVATFESKQKYSEVREGVELNECDCIWKPIRLRNENLIGEELEILELVRKFRRILNKLSFQKFHILMDQVRVRALEINDLLRLEIITDLIFEKAINEPMYSDVYAVLCYELSALKAPAGNETSPNFVSLRGLIITKTQVEFETNKVDEQVLKLEKEQMECTDAAKRKELQLLLEENNRRLRMRAVGNVKFIGELYKIKLLTSKIINYCMKYLIEKAEDVELECLCTLLRTVGEKVENRAISASANAIYKDKIRVYDGDTFKVDGAIYKDMQRILDNKEYKISRRVRFMMQDVMELEPRKCAEKSDLVTLPTIKYKKKPIKKLNSSSDIPRMYSILGSNNLHLQKSRRQREFANKHSQEAKASKNKGTVQTAALDHSNASQLLVTRGGQELVAEDLFEAITINETARSREEHMINECTLYGKLLAQKLMRLEDDDRVALMNSIDNLVFKTSMQAAAKDKTIRKVSDNTLKYF